MHGLLATHDGYLELHSRVHNAKNNLLKDKELSFGVEQSLRDALYIQVLMHRKVD